MQDNNKEIIDTKNVTIPKVKFNGDDRRLLERIIKFKAGTLRIIIFTLVGFILGWYSYMYTTDSFLITKVILAIPYKISEAIYTTVLGTGAMPRTGGGTEAIISHGSYLMYSEYFPYSYVATVLAEHITPVILGGAIYGSLAYFTGDKRVFTMSRFIKFASIWIVIILIFIGCVYGINAKEVHDASLVMFSIGGE